MMSGPPGSGRATKTRLPRKRSRSSLPMIANSKIRVGIASLTLSAFLWAQAPPPAPAQAPPAQPAPAQPQATTPPVAAPKPAAGTLGGVNFDNVSLTAVIDILAQKLKINYILDPKVSGKVT